MVWFQSRSEGRRPKRTNNVGLIQVRRTERDPGEPMVSHLNRGKKKTHVQVQSGRQSSLLLWFFFCVCVVVFLFTSSPDYVGPTHKRGPSAVFSLLIQMLISPRNTFTDNTQNNVWPKSQAPCGSVKLTQKIAPHRWRGVQTPHSFFKQSSFPFPVLSLRSCSFPQSGCT